MDHAFAKITVKAKSVAVQAAVPFLDKSIKPISLG
jgi:hypothetical protein